MHIDGEYRTVLPRAERQLAQRIWQQRVDPNSAGVNMNQRLRARREPLSIRLDEVLHLLRISTKKIIYSVARSRRRLAVTAKSLVHKLLLEVATRDTADNSLRSSNQALHRLSFYHRSA